MNLASDSCNMVNIFQKFITFPRIEDKDIQGDQIYPKMLPGMYYGIKNWTNYTKTSILSWKYAFKFSREMVKFLKSFWK